MKLSKLSRIIKNALYIGIAIMVLMLVFLPSIVKALDYEYNFLFSILYPCGICFIYLITEFIHLFKLLEEGKPFCNNVIKIFNHSMICVFIISFLIMIMVLLAIFMYHYNLSFIICISFMMILFFGVGIAFYILRELFIQAISYKEEVDLTI